MITGEYSSYYYVKINELSRPRIFPGDIVTFNPHHASSAARQWAGKDIGIVISVRTSEGKDLISVVWPT